MTGWTEMKEILLTIHTSPVSDRHSEVLTEESQMSAHIFVEISGNVWSMPAASAA